MAAKKGGVVTPCVVAIGDRFGMLVVTDIAKFPVSSRPTQTRWRCLCQCDCGSEPKWIDRSKLAGTQRTYSCGCIRQRIAAEKCKIIHATQAKNKDSQPKGKNYWKPRTPEQREQHRINAWRSRWRKKEVTLRTRKHGVFAMTLGEWCEILELDFEQVLVNLTKNTNLKIALKLDSLDVKIRLTRWIIEHQSQAG